MHIAVWCLLVILASAQHIEEDEWVEEDEFEEDNPEYRTKREVYYEPYEEVRIRREVYYDPYDDHVRVKRCEDEPVRRVRRSRDSDYVRNTRQVHQYEVHENTDDSAFPAPPYEEMLAASANHYYKSFESPGAPVAARYLSPDVSDIPIGVFQPLSVVSQLSNPPSIVSLASQRSSDRTLSPVSFINHSPSVVRPQHAFVPQPLPRIVHSASAPLKRLNGDQVLAAGHHSAKQHSQGHHQGGGHQHQENHHGQQGQKSHKGFHSDHHIDKGSKGHKLDENHKKEYEEAQGKKKKHHDHAEHQGEHEEAAHGHRGAKFDEKKGHKKGHKTKGYHNKYHKDEFHKEHKFYDDFHKSGEHHRYGKFHAKHASNESGKKKAHHVNAGHDVVEKGKKGFSNKGHLDSDHKGHHAKHGHEEHQQHHETHGKKGGGEGGKHWGYEKKH